MSKSAYPLKLPTSVKNAAARLAKADGVSLNQFIAVTVAEKKRPTFFSESCAGEPDEEPRKCLTDLRYKKVRSSARLPGDWRVR